MDFASLNGHHGGNSNGGAPPSMPSLDNISYYDDETFDRNVAVATEAHELTRLTRQQYEEALRILRQSQLQLPPSQPLPPLLQKLPQQHQMQPSQQQSSTSQLLMQPPPPPTSPPPAVTKAMKKRKVTTPAPRRNRPPATGGKKTKISQPSVIAATNAATTTTSSTVKQQQQQQQQQQRSFHSFVETLNCYNLLPCDWQQTLVASWTTDEVKLYTGRTQIHRTHHDQFHLLCQGMNVNPDCVKRQVAQKIQGLINGDSRTITVVTDQMALRFVHLWYAYATPATCALESTSVPNVVELLTTVATQDQQQLLVQIDNRLGRMCHLCMEYFLRFINGDRLYPSQQRPSQPQYLPLAQVPSPYRPPPTPQPSSPQPPSPQPPLPQVPLPQLPPPQLPSPATKKRKTAAATTVTPASSSAATSSTESTVAAVRVTGIGAARKKISAAAPLPSSSGGNSQQQQPSPSRLRLDDNVSYMSDYAMSTSDDDEDEYSDYDDQADNDAAATTDNSGPMTDGGESKKKQ